MKILLDKSKYSLQASEFLKNEELFASSVHCAYYSCIQLMRHILFNFLNKDENDFDNSQSNNKAGSHQNLLNTIIYNFYSNNINANSLKNDFKDIKDLRKNADYKQIVILEKDCKNALNLALKINNTLHQNYNL